MAKGRVGIFTQIFRCEGTIGRAIESILNQTYKNLTYYIAVNDTTIEHVEEYAKEDDRLKIICDEKESFTTYAQNMILDGNEYLASLDADDWYERNWLEVMVEFMEIHSLDVAVCGSRFVDIEGRLQGYRGLKENYIIEMGQFSKVFPEMYQFCRTIWGKLFSKQVILSFDTNKLPDSKKYGRYGGDTIRMLEILKGAGKFGVSREILHNYQVSLKSSSYTQVAEGRIHSDELLFRFAEDFLKRYGEVSRRNMLFLHSVYACAVKDTVRLIQTRMSEPEQARNCYSIFVNNLSRNTILLSKNGELMGESRGEFALYMAKLILKELYFLDEEQKDFCVLLLYQLQRSQDVLLKYVLQDANFVKHYSKLVLMIVSRDQKQVMELCDKLSSLEEDPPYQERLIEIQLYLAAFLDNIEYFIKGKRKKMQYFLKNNDILQAKQEYCDLLDMGITEEELCGCLSESDKNIIRVY